MTTAARLLEELSGRLQELTDFSQDCVAKELKGASVTLGVPHGVTMQVCRAAIVGQEVIWTPAQSHPLTTTQLLQPIMIGFGPN